MILLLAQRSTRRIAALTAIALVVIALTAARDTQNRIVFVALAVVFAVAAGLGALRWRRALARAPMRWGIAVAALAIVLATLFVDAARDKAQRDFPPRTTIAETFAADPRLPLWDATARFIRERPWTGYGYGRSILAPELRDAMGADLYEHAHNVFASQWLQTGAIGAALFVALVVAIGARYVAFYRSGDDRLAFIGIVGLSLIVGFVVKNLTDDFLYRSGAREFYALNAMLIGYGMRLRRVASTTSGRA
jgi:O-antigen ligase